VRSVTGLSSHGIPLALVRDVQRLIFLILTCLLWVPAAAADLRLEIDLSERRLEAIVDGGSVETFAVSVGKERNPTPTGAFSIRKVIWNPSWRPPDAEWAREKTAKAPGHPDNPMKRVKMFFQEPDYYIHGTDEEESLGKAASHGCIRMSPDDVTRLAKLVMEQGGKPMPEPWYRRIFHRRTTKVVFLETPVRLQIRS